MVKAECGKLLSYFDKWNTRKNSREILHNAIQKYSEDRKLVAASAALNAAVNGLESGVDAKKVWDYLDQFEDDADLEFAGSKEFWINFIRG